MSRFVLITFFFLIAAPRLLFSQSYTSDGRPSRNLKFALGTCKIEFEDGSMAEENITYYAGMQPYLTSQSPQGEVRYFPHQVSSFSNKYRKYVTVGNFPIHLSYSTNINRDFAELIESGPLELLIHQSYDVYTIPGANGAQQYGGIGKSIYLLRKAGEFAPSAAFSMNGKSDKQLRESLSPYLSSRPDLLEKLKKKSTSYEDIPACIHTYNTGQPFK